MPTRSGGGVRSIAVSFNTGRKSTQNNLVCNGNSRTPMFLLQK
jgi:hypothetical protein